MGARVVKTGLAVTLAAAICLYFDIPIIFAALSAVVNLKPSVVESWRNALEQVSVHLMGVVLAFGIGLTLGTDALTFGNHLTLQTKPLTLGLATVIMIWLCGRLGWTGGTLMGVLTALFILTAPPKEFVPHAVDRTLAVFTGLVVALAVNYLILPPRYGQKLRVTLRKLSDQVIEFFDEMMKRFVRLEPMAGEELEARKKTIQDLSNEATDLISRYREQVGKVKPRGTKPYNNPGFLEEYLRYQVGIFEKALELAEVTKQRIRRREQAGNQPLSEEFKQVLALMSHGAGTAVKLNRQLQQAIFDGEQVKPVPPTYRYWDEMAAVIESWHGKFSGTYYLHALVEVGAVIGDIKWATSKARELFESF
ncbi:MAG: aromatic acid exporter family protein [Clostridia bacterium]|nr:aromatic acid exporter family protein [Clostridia bacterium]